MSYRLYVIIKFCGHWANLGLSYSRPGSLQAFVRTCKTRCCLFSDFDSNFEFTFIQLMWIGLSSPNEFVVTSKTSHLFWTYFTYYLQYKGKIKISCNFCQCPFLIQYIYTRVFHRNSSIFSPTLVRKLLFGCCMNMVVDICLYWRQMWLGLYALLAASSLCNYLGNDVIWSYIWHW